MKVNNHTNIQDRKLKGIIDFVMPAEDKLFDSVFRPRLVVELRKGNGYGAWTYLNGYGYGKDKTYVILQIGGGTFPYNERDRRTSRVFLEDLRKNKPQTAGQQDYVDSLIMSKEESLVHIAAHEMWHLWQCLYKERISDRHADMYAIAKTREWRRIHSPIDAYPEIYAVV